MIATAARTRAAAARKIESGSMVVPPPRFPCNSSVLRGVSGVRAIVAWTSRRCHGEDRPMSTSTASPSPYYIPIRADWLDRRKETIIEPDLPIVDPHHHLWDG